MPSLPAELASSSSAFSRSMTNRAWGSRCRPAGLSAVPARPRSKRLHVEQGLKVGHLRSDGGLADFEVFRGAPEASRACDGDEILNLFDGRFAQGHTEGPSGREGSAINGDFA